MRFSLLLIVLLGMGCGDEKSVERCLGKACDTPPASICKDSSTVIEYSGPGQCIPATGECQYPSRERACAQGCQDGACRGETRPVFGYIAVFEAEVPWFAGADWFTGVGAYFAERPSYARFLPHQLEWFCTEAAAAGSCRLFFPCARVVARYDPCQPKCSEDQWCDSADATCKPFPRHFNIGEISISGTHPAFSMQPDTLDRYILASPPADLFDAGMDIEASAPGGALGALRLSARGVSPLVADAKVELVAGTATRFRWQATGDGSRVRLVLLGGLHDPAPPVGILCDIEESAGEVEILSELVDGFRQQSLVIQKPSYVMRYNRTVKISEMEHVELMIGAVRDVQICLSQGCR